MPAATRRERGVGRERRRREGEMGKGGEKETWVRGERIDGKGEREEEG